jgi:hypothetical protein
MSDDVMNELEADGQEVVSTDLNDLRALAHKQLELEAEVSKHEAALKDAKERLKKVQESDLPNALKAAGMTTFGLDNGMTVSYDEDLKVSVPKKNKAAVIKQMKEWGYTANVANLLTVDLGKGNDNVAKALSAQAEEMGVTAILSEDIATGTVKAALNKRIKEGKSDDLALFGAFSFTKSTVK